MEGWDSIRGRGKRFFSTSQRSDFLLGPPASHPIGTGGSSPPGVRRPSMKLTTHHHLLRRSRIVKLYLHSPVRLLGVMLN
jgi:hypothetical protein